MGTNEVVDAFRRWIMGCAGCTFAARFAKKKGFSAFLVQPYPLNALDLESIEKAIDDDGRAKRMSFVLFPTIRDPDSIRALLEFLCQSPRWSTNDVAWRNYKRPGSLVALDWSTSAGASITTMGFAPLPTMPFTRRSPCVALGVWGGGFENPFRKEKVDPVRVGLVDAAHRLKQAQYSQAWESTNALTKALLSDPPEDIVRFRDVTFCLPE